MNGVSGSAPWLRQYGAVPAHLEYPECTLYQMIAAAAARAPNAVAWDFFDHRSSYRQLLADVDTCADALAGLGLAANDRFLIAMPTTPQGSDRLLCGQQARRRAGVDPSAVNAA